MTKLVTSVSSLILMVAAVFSLSSESGAVATVAGEVQNLGDVNASRAEGTQSEVSIAVDRFRPHRLVAAAMNLPDGRILAMSSSDEGANWSQTQLPLAPNAEIHADPIVAFDSAGRAFLAHIPVGRGNTPLGIDVNRSMDGGRTWSPAVSVSQATDRDDKVILVADDNPESPFRDNVYVGWKWGSGSVFVSRSEDHGSTFTRPRLAYAGRVSGLDMAVASDGSLYLAFHDNPNDSVRVIRSQDGGETFDAATDAARVRADWYTRTPSSCRRMALVHASVAVDRSSRPSRGDVFVSWSDYPPGVDAAQCTNPCDPASPCTTDVYVSRSTDGARTWSEPMGVAEPRAGVDRYHQWLDSDPITGDLFVGYLDTRNDESRRGADVYVSRSTDCGTSWEPSVRASTDTSFAQGNRFQYGDYQGLAALGGNVYPAWAGFGPPSPERPRESDVYVGRLVFGSNGAAWTIDGSSRSHVTLTLATSGDSVLADTFVVVHRRGTPPMYLSPEGRLSATPRPYENAGASENTPYSLHLPRLSLRSIDRSSVLMVTRVRFGQRPDAGGAPITPPVLIPVSSLVDTARAGCQ